jgi:hypothetical protein
MRIENLEFRSDAVPLLLSMKDILFLLRPGFRDGEGAPYYCPYCAMIEGVLAMFPEVMPYLDVRHVDYPRPRSEIVALLDERHQSCPVLIVNRPIAAVEPSLPLVDVNGRKILEEPEDIGNYLSVAYGIPRPH